MTTRKSWCLIFSYYFLIIISTQSCLVDWLSEDLMLMRPDHIHFPPLHVSAEWTLPIVVVNYTLDTLVYYSLFNPFALLLLFSLKLLVTVEFCSQSNRLFNDLSTSFIFHHSHHLFVAASWYPWHVIFKVITWVQLISNIFIYILVEVFGFDLVGKTVSVWIFN